MLYTFDVLERSTSFKIWFFIRASPSPDFALLQGYPAHVPTRAAVKEKETLGIAQAQIDVCPLHTRFRMLYETQTHRSGPCRVEDGVSGYCRVVSPKG